MMKKYKNGVSQKLCLQLKREDIGVSRTLDTIIFLAVPLCQTAIKMLSDQDTVGYLFFVCQKENVGAEVSFLLSFWRAELVTHHAVPNSLKMG